MATDSAATYQAILARLATAAGPATCPAPARLLAVSKAKPAAAIRALAALGQRAFGENYLQEAVGKMDLLGDLPLEWHFIGHLQTNKAREVAARFQWVQSVDRPRLVTALAGARQPDAPVLDVLLQVNIDAEAGKSGCAAAEVPGLAAQVAAAPALRLRGLMAIPRPDAAQERRAAFARMRTLFERLRTQHPSVDTLSMGMSDDFELAIAEGATMVRIGTALFGAR